MIKWFTYCVLEWISIFNESFEYECQAINEKSLPLLLKILMFYVLYAEYKCIFSIVYIWNSDKNEVKKMPVQ